MGNESCFTAGKPELTQELESNRGLEVKGRYLRGLLRPRWGRAEEVVLPVRLFLPVSGPAPPPAWLSVQHEVQLYFDQLELSPPQCPTDCQVLAVLWLGLLKVEERDTQTPSR